MNNVETAMGREQHGYHHDVPNQWFAPALTYVIASSGHA
jgi:hypothetical protein